MEVSNSRTKSFYELKNMIEKHGKEVIADKLRKKEIVPVVPSRLISNEMRYILMTNMGYSEKAIKKISAKKESGIRPISDYKKLDGELMNNAKKRTPIESFINAYVFERHKERRFTQNEKNSLEKLTPLATKRMQYLQKRQIMNLAKLAKNLNFQNTVTMNNLSLNNNKETSAKVIRENWNAGGKQLYSRGTIYKLRKPTAPQTFISPITRREFMPNTAPYLSNVLNENYKGKTMLLKKYIQNPQKTTKEIANYYNRYVGKMRRL